MRRERLTLFFDGGCRPDPAGQARMETAVVAAGRVHIRDDHGPGDNTEAEWLALLDAVALAVAMGADDVVLIGDSETVVRQARGEWRCRSPQLLLHLAAFRAAAAGIARLHIRRVPRSRNLAGIALDLRRR